MSIFDDMHRARLREVAYQLLTALELHGDGCEACKRLIERANKTLKDTR